MEAWSPGGEVTGAWNSGADAGRDTAPQGVTSPQGSRIPCPPNELLDPLVVQNRVGDLGDPLRVGKSVKHRRKLLGGTRTKPVCGPAGPPTCVPPSAIPARIPVLCPNRRPSASHARRPRADLAPGPPRHREPRYRPPSRTTSAPGPRHAAHPSRACTACRARPGMDRALAGRRCGTLRRLLFVPLDALSRQIRPAQVVLGVRESLFGRHAEPSHRCFRIPIDTLCVQEPHPQTVHCGRPFVDCGPAEEFSGVRLVARHQFSFVVEPREGIGGQDLTMLGRPQEHSSASSPSCSTPSPCM